MKRIALTGQIRNHLRDKLVFNAYIIMAMRIFAGASGFLFWAGTARLMPAREVGLASATVAASMLLAGLAQLGLGYGLVRHLSDSETPDRLINAVLVTITGTGLTLALIFLVGLGLWSPALGPLRTSFEAIATFVALTVTTALTQLLNWYFLARRSPTYSLIKNTLQSGLAIVFLVILGMRTPGYLSAVHAYMLATAVSLVLALILYIPRAEPGGYSVRVVVPRTIRTPFARYSLTNFLADQFSRLANTLMPLLVVNVLGPDSAAYFFIVWSLAAGLGSIDESVSSSMFAESANDRTKIDAFTWRSARLTLAISTIVSLGTVLFSRFILMFYGQRYVENSTLPLIIVAIALIPASLPPVYSTFLRVRDRLGSLILFSGADIGMGILFSYMFMMSMGLVGVAVGWLISRVAVLLLMLILWRRGRQGTTSESGGDQAAATVQ